MGDLMEGCLCDHIHSVPTTSNARQKDTIKNQHHTTLSLHLMGQFYSSEGHEEYSSHGPELYRSVWKLVTAASTSDLDQGYDA